MDIQLLPSDVVNQISAGEVIERPANLVKELVENALDAGATDIQIDYDQGGRWLQIRDNGTGIEKGELSLALARHATSKIRKTEDLWRLQSFGFRGEALASAAAVSELTLTSRTPHAPGAWQLKSSFGSLSEVSPTPATMGTTIQVDRLFENVPARLKFLKSESAEGTQIKKVIKALAMAHSQVTFQIRCGGKLVAHYPSTANASQRIRDVLEVKEVFENRGERGGLACQIFFASPFETARTSQNLWFFAQSRWIQDRTIQAAVIESYRTLLMHGEFPQAVVFLSCDPARVDVNVHPTKSQVKFEDSGQLFQAVQSTLREGLERAPWNPQNLSPSAQPLQQKIQSHVEAYSAQSLQMPQQVGSLFDNFQEYKATRFAQKGHDSRSVPTSELPRQEETSSSLSSATAVGGQFWSTLQILGQANLTYILAQSRKGLFLIDQHAAHERVAFERLYQSWKAGKFETQNYLIPLTIEIDTPLLEALLAQAHELTRLGLSVEQMGPNLLAVQSAPAILKELAIHQGLMAMANELVEKGGSFSIEKKITDILATMACHSVVRAGQSLSPDEMKGLLVQMDEFSLSTFCPHGRPVYTEWSFSELDREFGRIV